MAAFGLIYEPETSNDIEIWPENFSAAKLFGAMQTQWLYKPNGYASGISYAGMNDVMELLGIGYRERREVFQRFTIMERAGMKELNRG